MAIRRHPAGGLVHVQETAAERAHPELPGHLLFQGHDHAAAGGVRQAVLGTPMHKRFSVGIVAVQPSVGADPQSAGAVFIKDATEVAQRGGAGRVQDMMFPGLRRQGVSIHAVVCSYPHYAGLVFVEAPYDTACGPIVHWRKATPVGGSNQPRRCPPSHTLPDGPACRACTTPRSEGRLMDWKRADAASYRWSCTVS